MQPGQYIYFTSGPELLAYAKRGGWDMSLFDVKGITAHNAPCCGILEIDELYEYSLTPSPANRSAQALAVKKNGAALGSRVTRGNTMTLKLNSICGAPALTVADMDTPWTAKAAAQRLREATGATTEPNAEYAKAFVVVDGPNDEFESYKLPFADVMEGVLFAVPAALRSAANVLGGLSGAAFELSDTVQTSAKTFVEGYYAKMDGQRVPWAADGAKHCWKGQYLGEYVEYSMCMAAMQSAFYALQYEVADAMVGYGAYGDMPADDLSATVAAMFDEHKQLCMTMFKAIMAGDAEESAETGAKSVRREMTTLVSSLGDGLTYTKHARVAVDAARELTVRTKERIEMRMKSDRSLSDVNRSVLNALRDALEECVKSIDAMLTQTQPKADTQKARLLRAQFLRRQAGIPASA
jgi:hypothetical protein